MYRKHPRPQKILTTFEYTTGRKAMARREQKRQKVPLKAIYRMNHRPARPRASVLLSDVPPIVWFSRNCV
jgi:hypothetical protein